MSHVFVRQRVAAIADVIGDVRADANREGVVVGGTDIWVANNGGGVTRLLP